MSNFTYAKISQYSDDVVKQIDLKKGKIQAINGETYTIDRKSGSTFAKFKAAVEKADYDKATDIVKESQFEILEPPKGKFTREERKLQGKQTKLGRKKWLELGWTEIEKKTFSVKNLTISTEEQEQITLLILKNILQKGGKKYKDFAHMFTADEKRKTGVFKIFPKLRKLDDWWKSYEMQFNQIKADKSFQDFPNAQYDVYNYNDPGSFMDYSTALVTKEIKFVSKKDAWNPADIWLLKSGAQKEFADKVDDMLDDLKGNGKLDLDKGQKEAAIVTINNLLKQAYEDRKIVGISLKKVMPKQKLTYTKFNLKAADAKGDLPNVYFNGIKLDCSYDEKTHKFNSKTSYLFVNDKSEGNTEAYKMAYKSNTGQGSPGNITYEFLPSGKAAAQLGKVPKESLKIWLDEQIKLFNIKGEKVKVEMPQATNLDDEWDVKTGKLWDRKVKFIKANFTGNKNTITDLDNFVKNLEDSYNNGGLLHNGPIGLAPNNASMMQMVDFTWILAKLKNQSNLIKFATLCYYFAQKKGVKYNFGPFGKLYSK